MKKFFAVLMGIMILLVMAGCNDNPKTVVLPTATIDIWSQLRECDIQYAKVMVDEVPVDDHNPPSFEGSSTHEVWALYVFGDKSVLDTIDPERLNDRWGNPINTIVANTNLDAISKSNETVWIYNKWGYLAGWEKKSEDLKVTGFCHSVSGNLSWTTADDLKKIGEYSFTYPSDNWYDTGFSIEIFTGKELYAGELRLLDFQTRALNEGTHWSGLGFIGPSSSTHGYFDLNDRNQLIWGFQWSSPDYNISENTGLVLPINTEIIIKTTWNSGESFLQRFVLVPGNYTHPDMIEPIDQPVYNLH